MAGDDVEVFIGICSKQARGADYVPDAWVWHQEGIEASVMPVCSAEHSELRDGTVEVTPVITSTGEEERHMAHLCRCRCCARTPLAHPATAPRPRLPSARSCGGLLRFASHATARWCSSAPARHDGGWRPACLALHMGKNWAAVWSGAAVACTWYLAGQRIALTVTEQPHGA